MVMPAAAAKTSPACCALSIQRCNSLLAVARLRRGANSPGHGSRPASIPCPAALASRPLPPKTHAATSLPHCPWRPRRSAAATVGCPRSIPTCPEPQRRAARQPAARSTPRHAATSPCPSPTDCKEAGETASRPPGHRQGDGCTSPAEPPAPHAAGPPFPGDDRQIAPVHMRSRPSSPPSARWPTENPASPQSATAMCEGEGQGEGEPRGTVLSEIPLTRIASNDAIRPLPAGGER